MSHADIRIGTLAGSATTRPELLAKLCALGFESFQLHFWKYLGDVDLKKLAAQVKDVLAEAQDCSLLGQKPIISSTALFGNPLMDKKTARDWAKLIDATPLFGCNLVCGFTGAVEGKPLPENMKTFKQVWGPLVKRAADKGVRIAFENCDMGGHWHAPLWNIAHAPSAWEMMFHEVPADNLGLEWEPCHQMNSLIDPLPQLRQWIKKVFHVHGKDATVQWDVVRTKGIRGGVPFVQHRTPGFGDTNWTDVISILRQHGYKGCIDIEGWHDPVYKGHLEMTGQVYALKYLQHCRGGSFVPNIA